MKRKAILIALLLMLSSHVAASCAWSLTDATGKPLSLDAYKGKWVLVNFWATWCPPCIAEISDLESLYKEGKLAVVGVAMSYKSKAEVLDFVKSKGVTYPVVLGSEEAAFQFGDLDSLPTSFLFSPDGRLAGKHEGPLSRQELISAMQEYHLPD
jgi:thiol-disulfide isomerase/thioredoxin